MDIKNKEAHLVKETSQHVDDKNRSTRAILLKENKKQKVHKRMRCKKQKKRETEKMRTKNTCEKYSQGNVRCESPPTIVKKTDASSKLRTERSGMDWATRNYWHKKKDRKIE